MRILIADDEPTHLFLLEMFLKKWGYEVRSVDSGAEAWRILDGVNSPRMAILDWQLPDLDGVEICRRLRQSPDRPYTYILLLTARAQQADIRKGLDAGADDYLTKPYDPEELQKRILAARTFLGSAAVRTDPGPASQDNSGIVAGRRPSAPPISNSKS